MPNGNTRDDERTYGYLLDRAGDVFVKVKLTTSVAAAGGFQLIGDDIAGNYQDIGDFMHHRGMRHVTIHKVGTKYRDTIPIADPGNVKYLDGGIIDGIAGRDGWKITGRRGEKYTAF